MIYDTIAAIATPIGTGGIGIIRISGRESIAAASLVFRSTAGDASGLPSHTVHRGSLHHPETGSLVDEVLLTVYRGPRSYTGEDVVEISCHGGIATLRTALEAVLAAGVRLAEPGEFTRRAFLNGKIDLAQAEAVNDLIRSRTDQARKVALRQLGGNLSKAVREVSDGLLNVIAAIEASVDFPDDVPEPDRDWLVGQVSAARERVDSLIATFRSGRVYREGIRVVIAGRVNVGKSSLLNALLRHARAIVTPIPGTTRDLIEESLEIEGIPVVAIDTAGLRPTSDPVESIGVDLARQSVESADIVVLVFDISEGPTQDDIELLNQVRDRPAIVVLNKVDLLPEEARSLATEEYAGRLGRSVPVVQTCASSGQGIDRLEAEIAALVGSRDIGAESVLVSNARHDALLNSAAYSLGQALATLNSGEPIDLTTIDLNAARASLGLITGETASDDLLDRIFGEFCTGK